MPDDIDLDAPALTKREALEKAQIKLQVVVDLFDQGESKWYDVDADNIREALKMVSLALKKEPTK